MPETRKFAQGLKRKGTAPPRRESSQHIRSSVYSDVDLVCGNKCCHINEALDCNFKCSSSVVVTYWFWFLPILALPMYRCFLALAVVNDIS